MNLKRNELEGLVLGYVVIAATLLTGLVTANAFGQHETDVSIVKLEAGQHQTETPSPVTLPQTRRRWILGVRADATQAGYFVEHVQSSSAASKAGIEAGDRIVCVNGQQVGFVDGKLVSLARSLDHSGSRSGHVRLLIQNRRNHRLVIVGAKLHRPLQSLGH